MTTLYKDFSKEDALELILIGRAPLYASHIIELHLRLGCDCTHCYTEMLESLIVDYGISSQELHSVALERAKACANMSEDELEEIDKFFLIKNRQAKETLCTSV